MKNQLLDVKPDGTIEQIHTESGKVIVTSTQPVDEIIRQNHFEQGQDQFKGFRIAPTYRKVASIPLELINHARARGIDLINDQAAIKRFLNDPNNKAWRTDTSRI